MAKGGFVYLFLNVRMTPEAEIDRIGWIMETADGTEVARAERDIAHDDSPDDSDTKIFRMSNAMREIEMTANRAAYDRIYLVGIDPVFTRARNEDRPFVSKKLPWTRDTINVISLIMGLRGLLEPPSAEEIIKLTGIWARNPSIPLRSAEYARDLFHWWRSNRVPYLQLVE